jgi:hypothetical protein
MDTFTSTLPDEWLDRLLQAAQSLSIFKKKRIEKALCIYLEQLKKAE